MKNVLLIGLGRFGRHMAQKLTDMRHQVLVIDKDERKVQAGMIQDHHFMDHGQFEVGVGVVNGDAAIFHKQEDAHDEYQKDKLGSAAGPCSGGKSAEQRRERKI